MFKLFSLFSCSSFAFFFALCPLTATALTQECETFIKSLPTNAVRGFIHVPENWAEPQGKKIQVFYYGYHLRENPTVSPLVYFNGGPGASAHGLDAYLKGKPDYIKVPFLFIDQRGTGCSSPLPPQEFTRRGVQQTALYGARSIVYDAEAIRIHVYRGRPWRIFGQSYGSFIVHRYIELAPQGLLAAYGHGHAVMTDGIAWTEMRARSYQRVGKEYFINYPGDREIINRARAIFPRNYCVQSPEIRVCGAPLLDNIGWSGLSFKEFNGWTNIHQQLSQLLLPTGELNLDFVKKLFPMTNESDPSTLLVDVAPGREGPGGFCNTWSCALAVPRMEARGERPLEYEFSECRNALAIERHFDYRLIKEVVMQDYVSLPRIVYQLKTHPQLKYFLYSGRLDTFGPEESFQQEVQALGSRVQYRAYAGGHGAYFEEPQTWRDILSTQ